MMWAFLCLLKTFALLAKSKPVKAKHTFRISHHPTLNLDACNADFVSLN